MKTPPPVKLDPKPMLDALGKLDAKRKEIADFEVFIKKQELDLADAIATGDPMNESEALQIAVLQSKVSMAPNYLRREVDKVPGLIKTYGEEVGNFESAILAAGVAESDFWLQTLEKALRPFCPDVKLAGADKPTNTVRGVVSRSPIFNLIPAHPVAFGGESTDLRLSRSVDGQSYWEDRAPQFEAAKRERMAALQRWAERHAKQGGRFVPDPIPAVLG